MIYMLDTNILIYLLKNKPPQVVTRVNQLTEADTLCMSFVSWAELLKGAEKSQRKADVLRSLQQLSRIIPIHYPQDAAICQHYAHHSARLQQAGTPIGGNDLWIASHALASHATLVTNNTREFARIPELKLENWAE